VARFRTVHIYPYSGWPQWPWEVGRDAPGPFDDDVLDRDAAARSARAVTEAISLALQSRSVQSRRSTYSIHLVQRHGAADIEVGTDLAFARHGFLGRVLISRGFRELLPEDRAAILLDVVGRNLAPLADAEGWRDTLDRVLDDVRAGGFECSWVSSWKRSPDHQHQVRIVARIADDGFGRWRVQISDSTGTVVRESPELVGWTWVENFQKMAKEMRFDTARRLVIGRGSMFMDDVTTIDVGSADVIDERSSRGEDGIPLRYPGLSGKSRPRVIDEIVPRVRFTGGSGPLSDDVMQYSWRAHELNEQIVAGPWVEWWQGAGLSEVHLPIWYTGTSAKVLLRNVGGRLTVTRYRPPRSIPSTAEAARDLARSDIELLISKVRVRFDLPTPPPLI